RRRNSLGEAGILRKEAVAGMDGLGARAQRGLDHCPAAQVALARDRRTNADGMVGQAHVQGTGVGLGIHGDGPDPEPAAGADHAAGDLAAVGNEDALEHRACGHVWSRWEPRRGARGWNTVTPRSRRHGRPARGTQSLLSIQAGARLPRNAARPSWPSGETRSAAISAALSASSASAGPPAITRRTSCLAEAAATGPALSSRSSCACT